MRYWINGGHRAPAWFVAVLDGELRRQIEYRQEILAQLAEYKPQDRAAWRAKMASKARAEMMAGIGAIGQRMARQRREAEEREKESRAIWAARDRETLSAGNRPTGNSPPEKNEPHN